MSLAYEEPLEGVKVRKLKKYTDTRGWLIETFRADELPEGFKPAMGYISLTHAGVARGPHPGPLQPLRPPPLRAGLSDAGHLAA